MNLLPLLLAAAALQEPEKPQEKGFPIAFYARATAWWPTLEGSVRFDHEWDPPAMGATEGSTIHLHEELDLGRGGIVPRFELGLAASHLGDMPSAVGVKLTYWAFTWAAEEPLSEAETFDGATFPAGAAVRSRIEVDYAGIDVFAPGYIDPEVPVGLQLELGARYLEVEVHMKGSGLRESEADIEGWWHIGIRAEWQPFPFAILTAEGSIGLQGNDLLAEVAVGAFVGWGPVFIEAGYRFFTVDNNDHRGEARTIVDLILQGPCLSLVVRF